MTNFFPSPGSYFEDILRLELVSKFPIDNKETTGKDNYFQAKKSDFDIVIEFVLYGSVTSALGSQTVREFFEEKNKRILAVIEYGNYKRAGFIARDTMEFDYSYGTEKNEDSLRFTCIGILGEFIDSLSTQSLPDYPNTATQQITFNTFIEQGIFDDVNQTRLTIENELDPVTKFGSQVYLSTPLYNDIRGRVTEIENLNKWIFFRDVAYTLGIKYDLECDFLSPSNNGVVTFKLKLKWRTGSSTTRNFTMLEHLKGFKMPEATKWVMVRDREWISSQDFGGVRLEMTVCAGILYNKDTVYFSNAGYGDQNNLFVLRIKISKVGTGEIMEEVNGTISRVNIVPNGFSFTELIDDINKINFITFDESQRFSVGTYPPLVLAGVMILARVFVKSFTYDAGIPPFYIKNYIDDTDGILESSTKAEYDFLLQDEEKETRTIKYDFPVGSEVELYDLVVHNGDNYSIERISVDPIDESLVTDEIKI